MAALFSLGSNGSGQLGIGHKEDVSVPKQVLFSQDAAPGPSSVRKVVAGGNHTLLLGGGGDLYWSGDPGSGACGEVAPGQAAADPGFRGLAGLPEEPFRVGLVAATWEASVLTRLDADGRNTRVYSFGTGLKGELGLGELIVRTPAPSLVPDFPPAGTEVVDLAACMGHVVAVLSSGEVYGWGNGRKGQLGAPEGIVGSPRKIGGVDFRVSRAVCGREFTLLVGSLDDGKVLFLGSDKWGMKSAVPPVASQWKDVGASWGNVYVLKKDGSLVSWGRNDHGQMTPRGLLPISEMAVGSEHVLAVDAEGSVLAWGWGEHGNCGPQVEDGDVRGRWNIIASPRYMPPGSTIDAIGAGCATSWIAIALPS